jgi:serine/threonine protein kinase
MTGRTILHYEVLEKLGAGGMGEIYKARDPRLNRTVAIKALPAGSTEDPERRRRFIQEAQAASGLNHPNIITIHDILTEDGSDYMVMEHVEGKTLAELIPSGGLGAGTTLQYAVQIADALAAAHAAGIVHRDLKPGNVMVTESGRVKVLDFGLAKVTVANRLTEDTQTIGAAPMTVEGSILGTVSYMSPEQAQGKKVDARSDIFSFGALAYEMVTGRKAFGGDSAITTLTAILRDEVRPIRDFAAGVPPELEEIILRALRKDPAHRWQSMKEVHDLLAALKQKIDSGILKAAQMLPPPPARKRSPWALIGVGMGLFFAIGGWWNSTHRTPRVAPQQPPAATIAPAPLPKQEDKPSPVAPAEPPLSPRPSAKKDDGTLTNDSILEMLQAKVADPVILSQIRAAPRTSFDLSTNEIIRLTKAGVSSPVMEAMRHPESTPAGPAIPAVETKPVSLIAGIPFAIELTSDVPNDAERGLPLRFALKQDFTVNGETVIRRGAIVSGEISSVRKSILGRGGKEMFRLTTVEAVDGSKISVRATPGKGGERAIEPAGRRDRAMLAPAGSEYLAYIDGAQTVRVPVQGPAK